MTSELLIGFFNTIWKRFFSLLYLLYFIICPAERTPLKRNAWHCLAGKHCFLPCIFLSGSDVKCGLWCFVGLNV